MEIEARAIIAICRKGASFWRRSFRRKLISIFVLIVLLNVVILGLILLRQVSKTIETDSIAYSSLVLRQANLNLSAYLQSIESFLFQLGASKELQSWSILVRSRPEQSVIPYRVLESDYIQSFANNFPDLLAVHLYHMDTDYDRFYSTDYSTAPGYSLGNELWVHDMGQNDPVTYRVDVHRNYVDGLMQPVEVASISMAKRFTYNGNVLVKVEIFPRLLQSVLDEMHLGHGGLGFIVDREGTIIAHPDRNKVLKKVDKPIKDQMDQAKHGSYLQLKSRDIVIFEPILNTDWYSVFVIPYDEIVSGVLDIRKILVMTAVACMLLSLAAISVVSRSLTRRLTQLKRAMIQIDHVHSHQLVEIEGEDEIAMLAVSYNRMLQDLERNIERLAQSQMVEKQAVLLSLQSQIDSHFLYNSLEIINSMATKIQHHDIENITISLSHMFRYTANFNRTNVTIRDEVAHLNNYINIIRLRYMERFSSVVTVSASCENAACLKVLLQPLVENAVKHGYQNRAAQLVVSVQIGLLNEETMEIVVSDNGAGFDPKKLAELRDKLNSEQSTDDEENNRIGLLNIQRRLRACYTEREFGITVSNLSSGGACVTVQFPYELVKGR